MESSLKQYLLTQKMRNKVGISNSCGANVKNHTTAKYES